MKKTTVKFCSHNLRFGLERTFKLINENHPDWFIDLNTCWGKCGQCASDPYALVDDDMIIADSPEELFVALEAYIDGETTEQIG